MNTYCKGTNIWQVCDNIQTNIFKTANIYWSKIECISKLFRSVENKNGKNAGIKVYYVKVLISSNKTLYTQ